MGEKKKGRRERAELVELECEWSQGLKASRFEGAWSGIGPSRDASNVAWTTKDRSRSSLFLSLFLVLPGDVDRAVKRCGGAPYRRGSDTSDS